MKPEKLHKARAFLTLFVLATPLLLFASRGGSYTWFFSLFALVPVLRVAKYTSTSKYLLLVYISLIIWNLLSLYWLFNTGYYVKITLLVILNSLLSLIPFWLFKKYGYSVSVLSWIVLEYMHLHTQIGFPFLLLGNTLLKQASIIQWYEYTGLLGGSLWILLCNVQLSQCLEDRKNYRKLIWVLISIIIPCLFSLYLLAARKNITEKKKAKFALLHTDLNCLKEKYTLSTDFLLDHYL